MLYALYKINSTYIIVHIALYSDDMRLYAYFVKKNHIYVILE